MNCRKCGIALEKHVWITPSFAGFPPWTPDHFGGFQIPYCEHKAEYTPEEREALAEHLAKTFHEAYERLAPNVGYQTRKESNVPWEEVPPANAELMRAVCRELIDREVVHVQLRSLFGNFQLWHPDDAVQSGNGDGSGDE